MDNSNWIKMGNNCPHARIALNNSVNYDKTQINKNRSNLDFTVKELILHYWL